MGSRAARGRSLLEGMNILRQEDGFALAFALLASIVLTIAAVSVTTYTTESQHAANLSGAAGAGDRRPPPEEL